MLFSIITVSLNAGKLIEGTINSVLNQEFTDYEIIIKDGCSTDDTLSYVPSDSRIRIIQKKDKGIYSAMNQGVEEAKGEYLLFLNCGDTLFDQTVLSKVAEVARDGQADIIYGNRYTDGLGIVKYPKKLRKIRFYDSTICHQASFINRKVFNVIGMYDETNKIASDWEFFLDAYIKKMKFVYMDEVICDFLEGGVSETLKGLELAKKEREKVIATRFTMGEKVFHKIITLKGVQRLLSIIHKRN